MGTISEACRLYQLDKGDFPAAEADWRHRAPNNETLGYCRLYEQLFGRYADRPFRMLEIGCNDWRFPLGSPRMWKRAFPQVDLWCLDIVDVGAALMEIGVGFFHGNQGDPWLLEKVRRKGPWDLIIDDGSHQVSDVLTTYHNLREACRGVYVIEDVCAAGIGSLYGHENARLLDLLPDLQRYRATSQREIYALWEECQSATQGASTDA